MKKKTIIQENRKYLVNGLKEVLYDIINLFVL